MNHRHFQPDDVFSVVDLRFALVVMSDLMMRIEVTVDDCRRMSRVGFMRMQWGETRSEDQERHRQTWHGSPSNSSKHRRHYVDPLPERQISARLGIDS